MATQTSNLNLTKPAEGEAYSVPVVNENMQKIDNFAGNANGAVITNQYSNIVDAINAFRTVKTFPFTIQKNGSASYGGLPSGISATCEWNALCIGNAQRLTVILTVYTGASSNNQTVWEENLYNGSVNMAWKQLAPYIAGTWTPQLYDYETYKRDLTSQVYFKIGNFYVMFIYQSNVDYSGITTMIQFRNLPCTACIGGTVYLQGRKTTIAKDVGAYIQGSGTKAYVRENTVSTDFANPSSSGITNAVLFGYD